MTKAKIIDFKLVNELFYYDETSPSCLRRIRTSKVAGGLEPKGYYVVRVGNSAYKVHRVIMVLNGAHLTEDCQVDHIDGNTRNNKLSNLRVSNYKGNARNHRMQSNNPYGIVGVKFDETPRGTHPRFSAHWTETALDGSKKYKTKHFSINKLGIMVAFRDAVVHRQKMIEQLNAQGAGYTDRHGKETK